MMANKTTCTQDKVDAANRYVSGGFAEQDEEIPTVSGLALYLGVARQTPLNWADQKNNSFSSKFAEVLDRLKAVQEVRCLNGALRNELNPQITKIVLVNHGYCDKQTVDHTTNGKDMAPTFASMYGKPKSESD